MDEAVIGAPRVTRVERRRVPIPWVFGVAQERTLGGQTKASALDLGAHERLVDLMRPQGVGEAAVRARTGVNDHVAPAWPEGAEHRPIHLIAVRLQPDRVMIKDVDQDDVAAIATVLSAVPQ